MVRRFQQTLMSVSVILILAITVIAAGEKEQNYQGCKLVTDGKGTITSMVYANLSTYLNVEKEFLFTVNADGTPANCTVTFNNGVQREMKPLELALHFEQCGGPKTVWDYYKDHDRIVTYAVGSDNVPFSAFGKMARIILKSGTEYIGRLAKLTDKPDAISLSIDGASGGPLIFSNPTIKEIQQFK